MLLTLLSILPFLVIIYFIVIRKVKAYKVMLAVYLLTIGLLAIFWEQSLDIIASASTKGFFQTIEVFLIIISILLLYNTLKHTNRLDEIKKFLNVYSNDKNILIILVGFFLVTFFEAIAGFGTPAAVAAPLLVFLGIPPITAIVLALISDGMSVAFGAFGTPIVIGISSSAPSADIRAITHLAGLIIAIISVFIPLFLLYLNKILSKTKTSIRPYISLALFAGLSYAIPFYMASRFLGPETPSVIGSIIGFLLTITYIELFHKKSSSKITNKKELTITFLPYLFLIILLIISRLDLFSFGSLLKSIALNLSFHESITYSLSLFSPGFLILFSFLLFIPLFRLNKKTLSKVFSNSFSQGKLAFITLLFTLGFVQLTIYSSINPQSHPSIPYLIASMFSSFGILYIIFAPLIGAFGSFIAGSSTVSNLIFTPLQSSAASLNSLPQPLILALQSIGGAAGNLIAIHNVVAALAVVGYKKSGGEAKIIRLNLIIVLCYCLIASFLGFIIYLIM